MLGALINAESRPDFNNFIEDIYCELRETTNGNKGENKRSLRDRVVQPVQKLPRYVLIIRELLKHTSEGHEDHAELLKESGL